MIVLAALVIWVMAYFYEKRLEVLATLPVYHALQSAPQDTKSLLQPHGWEILDDSTGRQLERSGSPILIDPQIRASFESGRIQLYTVAQGSLYWFQLDQRPLYVLNPDPPNAYIEFIGIGFLLLLWVLWMLYRFITDSITPLKDLATQIAQHQESGIVEGERIVQNDEVGQVAQAFYANAEKIGRLLRSRTLFMRNILHELNTPIAQGRLLLATTELPEEKRTILEGIFMQQQTLIGEFARVEQAVATDTLESCPTEWYLIDLIEGVLDELYAEESHIRNEITDERLYVDGRLFGIALKNLLGNALKYADSGTQVVITCEVNQLCIRNSGSPLQAPIEHYLQPFVQEKKKKGIGLGLYIVQEVLEKMGSSLRYVYEHGQHAFCIDLEPFMPDSSNRS